MPVTAEVFHVLLLLLLTACQSPVPSSVVEQVFVRAATAAFTHPVNSWMDSCSSEMFAIHIEFLCAPNLFHVVSCHSIKQPHAEYGTDVLHHPSRVVYLSPNMKTSNLSKGGSAVLKGQKTSCCCRPWTFGPWESRCTVSCLEW